MKMQIIALFLTGLFILSVITPVPAVGKPADFSDISSHWAAKTISLFASKGWVKGVPGGKFVPEQSITRGEFAVLMVRVLGLNYGEVQFIKEPKASDFFADVSDSAWYSYDIALIGFTGLMKVGKSRLFLPDQALTREGAAEIVAEIFKDKLEIGKNPDSIGLATDLKVLTFFSDGSFKPAKLVTRAEAAVILNRIRILQDGLLAREGESLTYTMTEETGNLDLPKENIFLVDNGGDLQNITIRQEFPTGGYSFEVAKIVPANPLIKVFIKVNRPGPGYMVTQAITYPTMQFNLKSLDLPPGELTYVLINHESEKIIRVYR